MQKAYLLAIVGILVVVVAGLGIYIRGQRIITGTPVEEELTLEEESFASDLADLEEFSKDTSLDDAEQYLMMLGEGETVSLEGIAPALVLVEDLESELSAELDSFSNDFSDLEEFNSDASLTGLESELSGLVQ